MQNVVYCGRVKTDILPYIVDLMSSLDDVKLHFYGQNTWVVPERSFIKKHGMVSLVEIHKIEQAADALISMGTTDSNFISSKIFEYMSTGNRIVHFSMSENDIDVSYLDRYKNAIVLSVGDPIACNSERLKRFLITPRLVIDWEMLKDSFPECTAEHTVQTICSYFSNHDHSRPIRRVLFLASSYGNTMGPAGACLHEVASAMKADGVQVHILGVQETGEPKEEIIAGFDIHRIKNSPRNRARLFLIKNHSGPKGKLAWFLRRLSGIQKLMLLPFFPMDQPLLCRKYARTAEKLINQYDIDLVVSMYHPFEALWAGAAIAKKLNTRLCLYCVDTLTDSNPQRIYLLSKEFRDRHGWVWEKKFFSRSDLILNFKCHEKNFQDKKYECWKDKMRIVDVPLLLDRIQDS